MEPLAEPLVDFLDHAVVKGASWHFRCNPSFQQFHGVVFRQNARVNHAMVFTRR